MGSYSDDGEEFRFFDAEENIELVSDENIELVSWNHPECSFDSPRADFQVPSSFQYDFWIRSPRSVQERRSKFLRWMGLSSDWRRDSFGSDSCHVSKGDIDRIMDRSGAVLRTLTFEDESLSSQVSMSSWSNDVSLRGLDLGEKFESRVGNSHGGMECNVDVTGRGGKLCKLKVAGAGQMVTAEEFGSSSSSHVSEPVHCDAEVAGKMGKIMNRVKNRWLSRLRSVTCTSNKQPEAESLAMGGSRLSWGARIHRVKVNHNRKQLKELSALFKGQEFQAHNGSILSMKFSPDGQYLASAGEDGIVRVWQIVEDDRSNEIDIPDIDPSCVYFTVNHLSELAPLVGERERICKFKSLRKRADSACVVFPPKVFRVLEKPLHEFHGHSGEILDLSWSQNNCLLSSSFDKTVRLWKVGFKECLKVFLHSNYVTCVQFNPMDDNNFISGSIDGKVRIWAIRDCQVVDWIDIRDIVTAVSYRPDGQGGILGSIIGSCRFFNLSDNHFQLEDSICFNSKKKSPCKRITGIQFLTQDGSKLLVTCADSQIRILHGTNVIAKYKGLRNGGNQILASFTSDGKHIVSASEDSNVYVWNYVQQDESSLFEPKTIRSFECFSTDASIAIPWSGLQTRNKDNGWNLGLLDDNAPNLMPFSSSACFSLGQEFFLESIPKGSATWPEEKLPTTSPRSVLSTMCKSQYKFLEASCQSSISSHAWCMVIVTAGWDGRIRSFLSYGLPSPP